MSKFMTTSGKNRDDKDVFGVAMRDPDSATVVLL
jgi:hypothetical protein